MITIVFATFNGASRLRRTLDSLVAQDYDDDWEVIIVDNGSIDSTSDILKEYVNSLPLTILFEPNGGKNSALNASLLYIKGSIIVFTDDDIKAEINWLTNISQTVHKYPEFAIFAGKIKPEWETEPANWIIDWAPLGALYALNSDVLEGECSPGKVWGPNMVVRADLFKISGLKFSEDIGPNGTDFYPMGSETDFTTRASEMGYRCFNSKSFTVYHWISSTSLTEVWIYNRARRLGRGVTMLSKSLGEINKIDKLNYQFQFIFYSIILFIPFIIDSRRRFWCKYKKMYFHGCCDAVRNKI